MLYNGKNRTHGITVVIRLVLLNLLYIVIMNVMENYFVVNTLSYEITFVFHVAHGHP
jgi:hypothetical protein